jgi:Xaa-Pro aminopeptidase
LKGPLAPGLFQRIRFKRFARIGIEKQRTTLATYEQLRIQHPRLRWKPVDGLLDSTFSVKDEAEIDSIRAAAAISDEVFSEMLDIIRPGMREADIAAEISHRQRRKGGEGDAFETIVASGERGALPHARATGKRIKKGECITLDFGCIIDGYSSDLTRTIAVGRISPRLRSMYEGVLASQLTALSVIRDGVAGRFPDAEARRVLRKRSLEKWFRHSLGHGLGLDVHEHPRVAPKSVDTLIAGQVVTVEPGVYIPGVGGVRIEDDIVVREHGVELLTHSPKGLITI